MKKSLSYTAAIMASIYLTLASWSAFRMMYEEAISPTKFGGISIMFNVAGIVIFVAILAVISFASRLNHLITGMLGVVAVLTGIILSTLVSSEQPEGSFFSILINLLFWPITFLFSSYEILLGPLGITMAVVLGIIISRRGTSK